jgi:metallophosphoesterase
MEMLILLTLCGILIPVYVYSCWERNQLKTEYYRIYSGKIKKKCRFVFLSDLHEKEFGEENALLLQRIQELKPDFILIGGDFPISHSSEDTDIRDEAEKGISLLDSLKRKYKVYYSFGNHEEKLLSKKEEKGQVSAFKKALEGVVLVDGRGIFLSEGLFLAGFPLDISYYQPLFFKEKKPLEDAVKEKWRKAFSGEKRADSSAFRIVLLHSPFYKEEALSLGEDLLLCGHFHGGAIGIPFFALMTPQYRFLVREPRGLFKKGKQYYFISRGLGTHTINLRLNNFPELSCFDLCPEEE